MISRLGVSWIASLTVEQIAEIEDLEEPFLLARPASVGELTPDSRRGAYMRRDPAGKGVALSVSELLDL